MAPLHSVSLYNPEFHRRLFRKYAVRIRRMYPALRFISAGLKRQGSFRNILPSLTIRLYFMINRFLPETGYFRYDARVSAHHPIPNSTNANMSRWFNFVSFSGLPKKFPEPFLSVPYADKKILSGTFRAGSPTISKPIRQSLFPAWHSGRPDTSGKSPLFRLNAVSFLTKIYSGSRFPGGSPWISKPVRQGFFPSGPPERPGIFAGFSLFRPDSASYLTKSYPRYDSSTGSDAMFIRIHAGPVPVELSRLSGNTFGFPKKQPAGGDYHRIFGENQNLSSERPEYPALPIYSPFPAFIVSQPGLFRKKFLTPGITDLIIGSIGKVFSVSRRGFKSKKTVQVIRQPEGHTTLHPVSPGSGTALPRHPPHTHSFSREVHYLQQEREHLSFASPLRSESLLEEVKRTVQEAKALREAETEVFRRADGKPAITGADIHQISNQVLRLLETRFIIERERRGQY